MQEILGVFTTLSSLFLGFFWMILDCSDNNKKNSTTKLNAHGLIDVILYGYFLVLSSYEYVRLGNKQNSNYLSELFFCVVAHKLIVKVELFESGAHSL